MVRRLVLALIAALTFANVAVAQIAPSPNEVKPPDVATPSLVAPLWKTDGTENITIDPTGTPPPQSGLTEVNPMTNSTGRISSAPTSDSTITGYVSGTTLTVVSVTSGALNSSEIPNIYLYGQAGLTGTPAPKITAGPGGVGTYTVSPSQPSIGSSGSPVTFYTTDGNFCLTTLASPPGPCAQDKFRTLSNVNHIFMDDPIRGYGSSGTSHCHEFFGNTVTNAFSTYSTLRNRNNSNSAGTDANATGYWFPCPVITNPFGDGKNYAVRSTEIILYYLENVASLGPTDTRIRRGTRYIFGANADDPDNSMLLENIYNLNQTSGSNRYGLTNSSGRFSNEGAYTCQGATPTTVLVLSNADGTDPYNGTCSTGQDFWIDISGANCWDGTNLWTKGGYNHVIKAIWDNNYGENACPYNYYRIPQLNQEIHFTQQGWTDRQRWRLSSDDQFQAKLDGFPICTTGYANAPCALGATFTGYISGTTLTVTSVTTGAMCLTTSLGIPGELGHNGYQIEGTGITGHPIIESPQVSGTQCGAGVYTLSTNQGTIGSSGSPVTLRASRYVANGWSIHEDWMFGWDNATIESWEFNCIGVEGHTPRECDNSQKDASSYLTGGRGETLVNGSTINTNASAYPTSSAANMFVVPAMSNGPMTMPTNN